MGLAGAAAGASNALQEILARAFAEKQAQEQLALRQQAQQQSADMDQQRMNLQIRNFDADEAYRTGQVERQGRLDDVADTERRQAENQRGVRRMIGDFLVQRGGQPLDPQSRQLLQGMAIQEDVDLPMSITNEPQVPEFTLSPGSKRFDAKGNVIASVPFAPVQGRDERLVQVMGPNGVPVWVRESQAVGQPAAQAARAVTGQERQALAYYNRAKDAADTIATADASGSSLEDRVASAGLGTQLGLQYAPNLLQTADQQAYRQAQRAFTEARLRKESGAAIPTAEYENDARTYFAQPGDTKEVVAQKRKARQVVLDGLKFGSGKAYDEFYGDQQQAPPTVDLKANEADYDFVNGKLVRRPK